MIGSVNRRMTFSNGKKTFFAISGFMQWNHIIILKEPRLKHANSY
ncbi:hypothetical protein JCM17380_01130 [Desulfosporosinus burensis]